jgi:hypothetical protein
MRTVEGCVTNILLRPAGRNNVLRQMRPWILVSYVPVKLLRYIPEIYRMFSDKQAKIRKRVLEIILKYEES